jgi:hypothetical protein
MRRRLLVAALTTGLGAFTLPAVASAVQFTLSDADVMHTEAGGAYVSADAGNAPADFTADGYATGTLYHRVTVNDLPMGANTTTYQVCFIQGAERACSDGSAISFDAAGEFTANQAMDTLSNYANIDWTMGIDDVEVVAMDSAGVPVDSTEDTWIGNPDFTLYYPLDVTYEAVVVANGDAFEGYPRDDVGNPAEAPAISPNGGTFEQMVSVSLTSATQDAMIYYTTDGSDPDDTSTLWDGTPIEITADTTLRAIAYADGFDPSPIAEATFTIVDMLSNGLRGRYYNGREFGELVMTRTDPTIEFTWDGTTPGPNVRQDFSVIWTGQVTPRYSNNYTFKTVNDDGVRLWVNDRLIIDDWEFHGPEEQTGNINLTADEPVSIWLEYFNGGGSGTVSLSWVSDEQPEELIPDTQMIPNLPANQPTTVTLLGGDENEIGESVTEPYIFEVGRRGNIDGETTVNLMVMGDATSGEDYEAIPGSVTFASGELTKQIQFLPIDDGDVEEDEQVQIAIADGDGYQISSPSSGAITILDNDIDVFSISGEIVYTGTESGNIVVEAFTEEQSVFEKRRVSLVNPGPFEILNVEPGDYNVIAYIDANDDEQLSDGETWGVHQNENLEPTLVTVPPSVTDIRINLDVAPGEDPDDPGGEGCCATIGSRNRISGGWLALLLGAVVLGLRRRRR